MTRPSSSRRSQSERGFLQGCGRRGRCMLASIGDALRAAGRDLRPASVSSRSATARRDGVNPRPVAEGADPGVEGAAVSPRAPSSRPQSRADLRGPPCGSPVRRLPGLVQPDVEEVREVLAGHLLGEGDELLSPRCRRRAPRPSRAAPRGTCASPIFWRSASSVIPPRVVDRAGEQVRRARRDRPAAGSRTRVVAGVAYSSSKICAVDLPPRVLAPRATATTWRTPRCSQISGQLVERDGVAEPLVRSSCASVPSPAPGNSGLVWVSSA